MRRPGYMNAQLRKGECGHFENGTWYICRRTSGRQKGSPNPDTVLIKLAVSLPSGRKDLSACGPSFAKPGEAQIFEFGYSYALRHCSGEWKRSLGADWEGIFLDFIRKQSPSSYLLRSAAIELPTGRNVKLQQERLWEMIPAVSQKLINDLRTLYVAFYPDRTEIAAPSEQHLAALTGLNIGLEDGVFL